MKILNRLWLSLIALFLLMQQAGAQQVTPGNQVVLPVRWVSFQAYKKDDRVLLQWTTLHEQLTRKFIIERSTDSRSFQPIGSIDASNDSYANASYEFYDEEPVEGLNFYRVRQLDANDDAAFSEIRKVNNYVRGTNLRVLNNIVSNGQLRITLQHAKRSQEKASIFSNYGLLMTTRMITPGSQSIDVSQLRSGTYYLHVGEEIRNFVIL